MGLLKDLKLIIVISRDVCRTASREKMMYGFLLLAFLFILMANVPFMIGDDKVFEGQPALASAVQIGFISINIFLLLIAVFVSLTTLQNFLSKERLVLLLSKPIKRWQILEGVALGLFEMVFLNWFLMTAGVWLVVVSQARILALYIWLGMSVAVLLALFYVMLVIFFYIMIPNAMAAIFAFFIVIASFGSSFAEGVFSSRSYPVLIHQALALGVNILPKINTLWGISMQKLGLFELKIHFFPVILHTFLLIAALNLVTAWRFRRFTQL
jgi:ABC-type transport system involved in multi-copper enzyme maturation permease subunit